MFMTTQLMSFKEALECMVGEYEVDGQCCPTCHPGYRVQETCSIMTGTTCVPCKPRTYTAHPSGLKECLKCKVCDPELGFETRRECSSTSNTLCGCSPGHFCIIMKGDDCELCEPHQVCAPGQYVKSPGTERSNTICEKCQEGTFSPNGTLGLCLPWTNCTAQGLSEEMPGTNTRDALCSLQKITEEKNYIIVSVSVIISLIIALLICFMVGRRRNNQERADDTTGKVSLSHHRKICDDLEADGSVSNFPMQETRQQDELLPLGSQDSEKS